MGEPFDPALTEPDDPETQAMLARLQARLFDIPVEPVRVGRFELLRVLGAGGMGVVHLGRDEVLGRHVAIKLIRRERSQPEARDRLLREAQAMARLSHPNVVQVYEAGEHAGRVFVAMEFIEGQTLRQWMDGEAVSRSWRERVAVLLAAGRGLAAAHEAGVVHRDFKPENVLLDAAGDAKVGDFSLAGVDARPSSRSSDDGPPGPLTQTGAVMGTPLYMAPEQHDAGIVDARSDQFAFCVVAYELLVGRRPFPGETLLELSESVTSGAVRPVPSGCPVPRRLLAVIRRGLEVDPARRWPSMQALLAAMAPRRRLLGVLAASGVAGLGLALGLVWVWPQPAVSSDAGSQCERGRSELADAWGPARRDAIEQALRATRLRYADDTFTRIAGSLDAYARDWADDYYEACTEAQDARLACLERARHELRLVTDELLAAQPDAIRHASDLVLSLPDLERCRPETDGPAGAIGGADPATARLEVASVNHPELRALLDEIDRATVLAESGRLGDADALLATLAGKAKALDRDLLVARIGVLRSGVAVRAGRLTDAHDLAHHALAAAERVQHDELELIAWRRLAVASRRTGEHARSAFELERAEAIAQRPTISAAHRADLRFDRADLLSRQNQPDAAITAYEAALAAYEALSPEHPQIAGVLSDMAAVQLVLGRQDAAIASSERALGLLVRRLGPQHPSLAPVLSSVADQYMVAGRTEDALALRRRALAIVEQGDQNPEKAVMLAAVVGGDLVSLRRFDEATLALEHAEELAREHLSSEHPMVGLIANVRGNLELDRRQFDAAIPHYERALALTPADDTLNRSVMLANISLAHARAGRVDDALERAEQTRAVIQSLAPESAPRVSFEIYLAEVDRLAGRHVEARAGFSRALSLLDQLEIADELRLMVWFGLAREQNHRARARDYATRARAIAERRPGFEHELEEIDAWLAEHP